MLIGKLLFFPAELLELDTLWRLRDNFSTLELDLRLDILPLRVLKFYNTYFKRGDWSSNVCMDLTG